MPVMTKTPAGEEIVILSRHEYDTLLAATDDDATDAGRANQILAELANGTEILLTDDEMDQLLAAKTPLAFWRKKRGLTQEALSKQAHVAQGFLSEIENGSKSGDIQTIARIARALGVVMDDLVIEKAQDRPKRRSGRRATRQVGKKKANEGRTAQRKLA